MPAGVGTGTEAKRVRLRQRHTQAGLQAGDLARLHGLVRAELLPQRLQLAAYPGRLLARGLHRSQRPRLDLRQPARSASHPSVPWPHDCACMHAGVLAYPFLSWLHDCACMRAGLAAHPFPVLAA